MTIPEFVREVEKLGLKWHLTSTGLLRCERGFCPIAALVYARGHDASNITAKYDGTNFLGLSPEDATTIINHADAEGFGDVDDDDDDLGDDDGSFPLAPPDGVEDILAPIRAGAKKPSYE